MSSASSGSHAPRAAVNPRKTRRAAHPPWLVKRLQPHGAGERVRAILQDLGLSTVCRSARCPNASECFHHGTATFMILGDVCTRNCGFCAVTSGTPAPVDQSEPERVALAVRRMELTHAVVTSVTRDDLADGGADHFARTIHAIREQSPATVEVLTPDFGGDRDALERVLSARPDVFNHNIETVRRLYNVARPQADYDRSLAILRGAAQRSGRAIAVKSGLMVGLGERDDELEQTFADLLSVGVQILTIGQYLAPTSAHVSVNRYVSPEAFQALKTAALDAGVAFVASGPFVRSSYHAREAFDGLRADRTESTHSYRTVDCKE